MLKWSIFLALLTINPHARVPDPALVETLKRICSEPFLECDTTPVKPANITADTSTILPPGVDVRAGTFGAGVGATLYNDPDVYGARIYRNCPLIGGEPQCSESHLYNGTEALRVFIKIGFAKKADHETSFDVHLRAQGVSGWEAEVERVHMFADAGFGPAILVVQNVTKDGTFWCQKEAYLMEHLGPYTARHAVKQIIRELSEWVKNDDLALHHEDDFIWRLHAISRMSWEIVSKVEKLHSSGLAHCDLHPNNLMFRAVKVQPDTADWEKLWRAHQDLELVLLRQNGRPVLLRELEDKMTEKWETEEFGDMEKPRDAEPVQPGDELWAMHLVPEELYIIDASFGINVTLYGDDDQPVPCRLHSSCRADDVAELDKYFSLVVSGLETIHDDLLDKREDFYDAVDKTLNRVIDAHEEVQSAPQNTAWDDCAIHNARFKLERKRRNLKARRLWCQQGYTQLPQCTWRNQTLALQTAQNLLQRVARVEV